MAEGLLHFAGAGALGGVFIASPAVSAELHIGFSPPCAVSLMLLVSQNNCIINNVRVNGSGGKTPSGSAGLRLQPDFRIYVFLIYAFGKCPRSYYWGGGLRITRPGFIHRPKKNYQSDISPFLGSIGPALKMS